MHLYIRADADSKIGTGHVMRCIALAQGWQDRGGKVTFLSHCESEELQERITNEGFEFLFLEKMHPHPSDLEQTLENLSSIIHHPSSNYWLVLDGYHFTSEYQKALRDAGIRCLVIDDMNHLPHYHVDIILDQNIYATDMDYRCDEDTTLLLGTKYVLLRREFLKYRNFNRQIPESATNILVTLGGADPDNVTLKVMYALEQVQVNGLEAVVVVGGSNPHYETLQSAIRNLQPKIRLECNASNMPELMAWADVAVSAGGSTVWELIFMVVPSVVMILADNQKEIAEELEKEDVVVNLGWHEDVTEMDIRDAVQNLLADSDKRRSMGLKGKALVDGRGVERTIERICATVEEDK
ncbi:MAG: UDP-2,4-diacetamido-2,4,6-trideoxy-beta-L-altropyranose hydrolase [Deltaproteobacteria bacterium]|nr:UDP-2,4-diacetamido-2,4,6-trideoxy-beta-L-altropyranose hydrolase [Deltaproteobacteria bacterium]